LFQIHSAENWSRDLRLSGRLLVSACIRAAISRTSRTDRENVCRRFPGDLVDALHVWDCRAVSGEALSKKSITAEVAEKISEVAEQEFLGVLGDSSAISAVKDFRSWPLKLPA